MLDIRRWLWRRFNDDVRSYGNPETDLRVCCPFCYGRYGKTDVKYKLYVSIHKPVAHCFRCGYSRSWIGLVMDVDDVHYAGALHELYVVPSVREFDTIRNDLLAVVDGRKYVTVSVGDNVLPDDFIRLDSSIDTTLARSARAYLRYRGYGDAHIRRYGLGVAHSLGDRVIIPVEGNYWQARAIYPFIEPKYLNPSASCSSFIFNYRALAVYDEVVLCEGAFSAMAVGPNAVGLLHNAATGEQLSRLIAAGTRRYIVALDSDAHRQAIVLGRQLHRRGKTVVLWLYEKGDPADGGSFKEVVFTMRSELGVLLGMQ